MSQKEILRILDRDVFFVQPSTETEKKIFSDKKEGGFFTFALESGQKFVACFSEKGRALKKKKILTFRPLNNMVSGLKEFSWIIPPVLSFSQVQLDCKFADNLSRDERADYMYALCPGGIDDMFDRSWPDPKLLKKAKEVQSAYFSEFRSQKKLNKVLIPMAQTKVKGKTR